VPSPPPPEALATGGADTARCEFFPTDGVVCFGWEAALEDVVVLEAGAVVPPLPVPVDVFEPTPAAELGTGPRAVGTFSMYCATDESLGTTGGGAALAPAADNPTDEIATQHAQARRRRLLGADVRAMIEGLV
jgi:hypothetical protein